MSLIGHQITSVSRRPGRSIAQRVVTKMARLAELRLLFGPFEALVAGFGIVLTICGPLWAVQENVALPVVLMLAYCMLLTTVALTVALCVARNASGKSVVTKAAAQSVNLSAWKLLSKFNVSNASRLWCDVEPGHPYTQESAAWASAMLDAIRTGALPIVPRPGASEEAVLRERANPTWHTVIARDALRSWAELHGRCPVFLQN